MRLRALGLSLLLVALAACACARHESANAPRSADIEVQVSTIGFDQRSGSHFVLLEDPKRDRVLPILIGESEARAIALEIHGLKPPRPLTQDLLREVLRATGNHVDHVVIYTARKRIYYARISLDDGRHKIDARPSDAIALAIGMHAPIYVNSRLLMPRSAVALGPPRSRLPQSARGFGLTVQELTPEIAKYLNVEPGSGLLVSAADTDARAAGIRRGDILVAIAGRAVKALSDFDRETAAAHAGTHVTLTVQRDGVRHSITLNRSSDD